MKPRKRSKKSRHQSAKKKLDEVFSRWIRLKDADRNGYCTCVTCGKFDHWKKMQAGHYVSRLYMATRWVPENVHVQCPSCNLFKKGAMDEYALFIISKYGQEQLEKLNMAKKRTAKFHSYDLEAMIKVYERELDNLQGGTTCSS